MYSCFLAIAHVFLGALWLYMITGIILWMRPASYNVASSLISLPRSQNDPCGKRELYAMEYADGFVVLCIVVGPFGFTR